MKKKNFFLRLSNFKKFLIIYSGILVIVGVVLLFMLHSLLSDYEEGFPATTMDKVVEDFTPNNIEKLLKDNDVQVSEFETSDVIVDYLKESIGDTKVTYKKKSGEYSENTPVYVIYAEKTPIAKVSLKSKGKNSHNFNKWELGSIEFGDYTKKMDDVKITVPAGAFVYINDVLVNDEYKTEAEKQFAPCLHVGDYTTTPKINVYTVDKLIAKPDIKVLFDNKALNVEETKEGYVANYPDDKDLYESQKDKIMEIAEQYGAYIINRGSLTKLQSYMTGYAAEYVSDIPAIWAFLYGKSYTYEFKDENITEFRKYNDSCFSCNVSYKLYVNYGTGDTTYDTSMTYTFVKKDDKWVLADFILN